MESIFTIIVVILAVLAIAVLIVGVTNDAVNFLNSALGSKVAPRYVILTVASVGILLGSVFSSGMMEVARSGVFHPEMYTFADIMMLFLAVMFTNVILLDTFNTFGLPTSTTVSLVFGLLGSAIAIALHKIWTLPEESTVHLAQFINSGNAMGIIAGILLSVVLAFVCGVTIMYISRLIFSFRYQRVFNRIGSIWCGVALTAITYFAVIKGLKDSTLVSKEFIAWIYENLSLVLLGVWVFWTLVMLFIQKVFKKVNILKITILAGTFALALAFAGNDLVNFIGVFMAGYDSYQIATATGDANMTMEALLNPVTANIGILLTAGIIMIYALWTSKKARSVTETEINLARQDSGVERFGSTSASRAIVRNAMNFNKKLEEVVPERMRRFAASRFRPAVIENDKERAPFDMIRATVNLTVAALLISLATSYKLPLSTTYVTFMVAMGSSLADKAWGRESAVYRITGVLTVISGWFLTAFIAFTVAFLIALALMYGKTFAVLGITALCVVLIIQSNILHKKKQKKQQGAQAKEEWDESNIIDQCAREICQTMQKVTYVYDQTLTGLFTEDRKLLKQMVKESEDLYASAHERKYSLHTMLRKLSDSNYISTGHYYVQVVDYEDEVAKALVHITRPSFNHIDNNHQGLSKDQIQDLKEIGEKVGVIYAMINHMLKSNDFSKIDTTLHLRDNLFEEFAEAIKNQIYRIKKNETSTKGSMLYMAIINETKTMILQSRNLLKAQKHFMAMAQEHSEEDYPYED